MSLETTNCLGYPGYQPSLKLQPTPVYFTWPNPRVEALEARVADLERRVLHLQRALRRRGKREQAQEG